MAEQVTRKHILNVVGPFLAAYGWVAFVCFFILVIGWAHTGPMVSDPTHGLVYRHNEHGSITYFSAFQTTASTLLFATSIPLSFLGILVSPKRDVIYRRGFLSISAKWNADDPKRLQRFGFLSGAAAAPVFVFVLGPSLVEWLNALGIVLPFG